MGGPGRPNVGCAQVYKLYSNRATNNIVINILLFNVTPTYQMAWCDSLNTIPLGFDVVTKNGCKHWTRNKVLINVELVIHQTKHRSHCRMFSIYIWLLHVCKNEQHK